MSLKRYAATGLVLSLALVACTTHKTVDISPTTPPVQGLTAAQVNALFAGETWNWNNPKNNLSGITIYDTNGQLMVEAKGKGKGIGTWRATDGHLCETIRPSPIAPSGIAEKCRPISGTGPTYQIGDATFTPA